jgi:acetyltransferase-like isoleucine patch superfamily enzyme
MHLVSEFINEANYPWLDIAVGKHSYGKPRILSNPGDKRKLTIGAFCSIAENVKIFVGTFGIHPVHLPSTFPLSQLYSISSDSYDRSHLFGNLDTTIGSDVWIGRDSTIFSGLTIGDGAVIGTGALVTKDVPPYSIVGGVPAKVIRYRFEKDVVRDLLDLKWWELSDHIIIENLHLFYQTDLKKFISHLSMNKRGWLLNITTS